MAKAAVMDGKLSDMLCSSQYVLHLDLEKAIIQYPPVTARHEDLHGYIHSFYNIKTTPDTALEYKAQISSETERLVEDIKFRHLPLQHPSWTFSLVVVHLLSCSVRSAVSTTLPCPIRTLPGQDFRARRLPIKVCVSIFEDSDCQREEVATMVSDYEILITYLLSELFVDCV